MDYYKTMKKMIKFFYGFAYSVLLLVIVFIIQVESASEELPFIFKTPEIKERFVSPEMIIGDLKFLSKRYGINMFEIDWYEAFRKYIDKFPDSVKKEQNLFFRGDILGGGRLGYLQFLWNISEDEAKKLIPFPVNNKGEKLTNAYWDRFHPDYLTKYIYPLIDDYLNRLGNVVLDMEEYYIAHPCYSPEDIKAMREDLAGENEGVEWLFADGSIKKIDFWEYAWLRFGLNKEEYRPEMLGSFTNYNEYLPADIEAYGTAGDFLPGEETLFAKIPPVSDINYWKNIDMFLSLLEYEYFKHCQKISKYAKQKGAKYVVWGPGGVEPDFVHDPYVDYHGGRIALTERFGVIPGTAPRLDSSVVYKTVFYITHPYLIQMQNEEYNKATLGSIETGEPYRNPISFYHDAFAHFLVGLTLLKPKLVNIEQFATPMLVHKDGMSGFSRQFIEGLTDATIQARESGLIEGRLYGSTWLTIPTSHEFNLFYDGWHAFWNTGDMRSELVLNGYIPEVRFELGGKDIPDKYKIVTLAGTYYPDKTISLIKDWLSNGKGKTFVANYDHFATYLLGSKESKLGRLKRNRFTDLGVWKTNKVGDYTINKITWVDDEVFPNVKIFDGVNLTCVLPRKDIQESIPDNAKVLMKGETKDGEEVPLIIFVPIGENSIVNIVFPLGGGSTSFNPEYRIEPSIDFKFYSHVMRDLFSFLQRKYEFNVTRVKAEPDLPMTLLFRMPVKDKKGTTTIVARGDAIYGDEDKYWIIDSVKLTFEGTEVVSKIKNRSMVIAAVDGSTLASVSDISLNGKTYVKTTEDVLWLLSSFETKPYEEASGFHLWTRTPVGFSLRLPKTWQGKKVEVYSLVDKEPKNLSVRIDSGFIVFKAPGGECKIYCGKPNLSMLTQMKKRVDDLNYPHPFDLFKYLDNLSWKSAKVGEHQQMNGISWFRSNNVAIPKNWEKDSLVLQFGNHEGGGNALLIYVNQQVVGYSFFYEYVPGRDDEPRRYIVPKTLWKYGENNKILVRVEGSALLRLPVRIINPNKGEILDLSKCSWEFAYSQKD